MTLMMSCFSVYSADSTLVKKDTLWKTGGLFNLTFSQNHFNNDWVGGGQNSVAFNSRINLFANYTKGNLAWDNALDLAYGRSQQGELEWRKNDDLIDLNTKIGYKASKKWFYSAILQFKTQFDDGYKYFDDDPEKDRVLRSKFLTPAYTNLGLGMDYKPVDYLSVFMTPLNLKTTYVSDTIYGPLYSIDPGKHLLAKYGALIKARFQKDLLDNVNLLSTLDLFSNYEELALDKTDLTWEVLLTVKLWKIISFNVNTVLIYDADVKPLDENKEGPVWQFKEVLGFGLAYKF